MWWEEREQRERGKNRAEPAGQTALLSDPPRIIPIGEQDILRATLISMWQLLYFENVAHGRQ